MSIVGGSSLAEARELYQLLQECMDLLNRVESHAKTTTISMTRLLSVTNSLLIALESHGYGGNYEDTLNKIRFVIRMLQTLQTIAVLTNIALTTGPAGAILGAIGIGLTVAGLVDTASMVI